MVPVELQLSLGAPVACTEASKRNGEREREGRFDTAAGKEEENSRASDTDVVHEKSITV